jgi:hypothetical protein
MDGELNFSMFINGFYVLIKHFTCVFIGIISNHLLALHLGISLLILIQINN